MGTTQFQTCRDNRSAPTTLLSFGLREADMLQDLVREPVAGLSDRGMMPNLYHDLVSAVHML
jgi:hypothetical protein